MVVLRFTALGVEAGWQWLVVYGRTNCLSDQEAKEKRKMLRSCNLVNGLPTVT